jgi:segregation and condensation protein B
MDEKTAIIEALIFASDAPLTAERIAEVLGDTDRKEVASLLEQLSKHYEERGSGISLFEVAGGYQFRTRPDLAPWLRKLKAGRPASLSPAAMETLAVVAYRQPIVKSDVDRIRGVDTSGALKGLLEKKLVRIVGRKDVPGKPIIYGTTRKFLEVFNLNDLSEMPTLREMKDFQGADELSSGVCSGSPRASVPVSEEEPLESLGETAASERVPEVEPPDAVPEDDPSDAIREVGRSEAIAESDPAESVPEAGSSEPFSEAEPSEESK